MDENSQRKSGGYVKNMVGFALLASVSILALFCYVIFGATPVDTETVSTHDNSSENGNDAIVVYSVKRLPMKVYAGPSVNYDVLIEVNDKDMAGRVLGEYGVWYRVGFDTTSKPTLWVRKVDVDVFSNGGFIPKLSKASVEKLTKGQ